MVLRRPLVAPPSQPAASIRYMQVRHPAYPETDAPLLLFAAIDGEKPRGVYHDAVLTACGVVTGNTWPEGFLCTEIGDDGYMVPCDVPEDGILRQGRYYYCLSVRHHRSYKYPVVASFHHWRFPHGKLPDMWSQVDIAKWTPFPGISGPLSALARDETCRVSGHQSTLVAAFLVPPTEKDWFGSNYMEKYCAKSRNPQPMKDQANCVALRSDINRLFVTRRFALVPKLGWHDEVELGIHIFQHDQSPDLINLYHNRSLHLLRGISIEYLLARFALTVFDEANMPFFNGMTMRTTQLFDPVTGQSEIQSLPAYTIRQKKHLFCSLAPGLTAATKAVKKSSGSVGDKSQPSVCKKYAVPELALQTPAQRAQDSLDPSCSPVDSAID